MKIRNGFVSNSSSSSFLIYGVALETSEFRELFVKNLQENVEVLPEYAKKLLENPDDFDYDYDYELGEAACKMLGEDFSLDSPSEWDTFYIGRSWGSVRDNETGKQFKESVETQLKKYFGEDVEIGTHSEAWFDG